MSTPTVDRHGERVELDWDLTSFSANPCVLWAHDSRDLPLGRAENVRIESGALQGRIRFASATANPKAEQCLQLFREGVLNAVSVGFIPHSYRFEKDDDEEILVLSQNELVELSVTPTPANPEALARRRAKALATRTESPPADPESNTTEGAPPRKEQTMSENEKSLQDKVEKQVATITMLETRASQAEAAVTDLTSKVKSLETDKAALEAQAKTLTADRDAEKARADKAEGEITEAKEKAAAQVIELEVESLVGKKITPAEKPLFVDLRKSNPDLFAKMIEQRQDLKLTESVTEKGAAKNGAPAVIGNVDDLLAEINQTIGR
jgi:HK97 family phage prohead protease